jgi:hypothetical protein
LNYCFTTAFFCFTAAQRHLLYCGAAARSKAEDSSSKAVVKAAKKKKLQSATARRSKSM